MMMMMTMMMKIIIVIDVAIRNSHNLYSTSTEKLQEYAHLKRSEQEHGSRKRPI